VFESESGKLGYAVCTRWTYVLGTMFDIGKFILVLYSYLEGHGQRPYGIPSSIKNAWLVSLGI
jgi:hypothetical protein